MLSDHGFAPYNRSFNLNTWLLNNGYIKLKSGASTDSSEPLANVDWTQTRAYGLGLNGLYLNLKGRETNGIVEPERRRRANGRDSRQTARGSRSKIAAASDHSHRPRQRGLSGTVRADLVRTC